MYSNFTPKIGILCWELSQVTRSIKQLSKMKRHCTNPDSYSYPVIIRRVEGINAKTVVIRPNENVLNKYIKESKEMISRGVKAITTSGGFNAIHQKKLADAVDVPVFTSSLMQIPFVSRMLRSDQSVAVITARGSSLTNEHMQNAGIGRDISLHVFGVEDCREWGKLLNLSKGEMDLEIAEEEIISISMNAIKDHHEIGAFVLECTDMCPFADAIKKATILPVFDFITMTNYVYQAI